jgi:phosphatidylserine/phosphatidylglycerophosphate/cardiolipin synthase-like enzyme
MATIPVVSTGADIDGGSAPIVLLSRVAPSTPLEFVTIENVSNLTMNAYGWAIDDGEGWIKINISIPIGPGERLSLTTDAVAFSSFYPEERALAYRCGDVVRHSTFALADKGDQVSLVEPGGNAVDTFCYGSCIPSPGWIGVPFAPLPKGDMAVRNNEHVDTGTASDWFRSCAGRSELSLTSYHASVDPFTAPEGSLDRLWREIGIAQTSIEACVYELGDPAVTEAFVAASGRGVMVSLLIEGQPVTGLSNSSKTAVLKLMDAGCDVRLMTSNQSYRRYDCLHAKYLIIDRERVTVMSENWAGGLVSNRGWGVTVFSPELAADIEEMFAEDSSMDRRDIVEASTVVKGWYSPPSVAEIPGAQATATTSVMADISLIASPDTSFQGIIDLVSSASERLLVEQLYIDPAWVESNQILDELVDAAGRGVQVRVLMDETFVSTSDTRNNSMTMESLNALAQERGLDLQARLVSSYHDFGVMHNKGVIADDSVLVSSVNWVDVSVFQNREVGLVISSPTVSSYFADSFWKDWAIDPDPPTVSLPWDNLTIIEGQPIVLDASECHDRAGIASYLWTDRSTGEEWNGSYVLAYLEIGIHEIRLTVTDRYGNEATADMLVIVNPAVPSEGPNYLVIIPAGIAGMTFALWAVVRRLMKR